MFSSTARVCQELLRWTKIQSHSNNNLDIATKLLALYLVFIVPSNKPRCRMLSPFVPILPHLSILFISCYSALEAMQHGSEFFYHTQIDQNYCESHGSGMMDHFMAPFMLHNNTTWVTISEIFMERDYISVHYNSI